MTAIKGLNTDEVTITSVALGLAKQANYVTRSFRRAGPAILTAGSLAAASAAGNEILRLRNSIKTQNQFNNALAHAVSRNTILASANKEDIATMAQSIYNLAPNAAGDPNVLQTVLAHSVQGNGLDPRTARDLMELEEKHQKLQQMNEISGMDMARLGVSAISATKA